MFTGERISSVSVSILKYYILLYKIPYTVYSLQLHSHSHEMWIFFSKKEKIFLYWFKYFNKKYVITYFVHFF